MVSSANEIEHSLSVPVSSETAFERFVDDLNRWWPREYSWSQEKLDWIGIDARVGGRCTERSSDDFTVDFGSVLTVQRPSRISFAWCIDPSRVPIPDIEKASVVSIEFISLGAGSTKITLRHSKFDRHNEKGAEYKEIMASKYGWPYIMQKYTASFVD